VNNRINSQLHIFKQFIESTLINTMRLF